MIGKRDQVNPYLSTRSTHVPTHPIRSFLPTHPTATARTTIQAIWEYNQNNEDPNNLTFSPGDIITADWWTGRPHGRTGCSLFPMSKRFVFTSTPCPFLSFSIPFMARDQECRRQYQTEWQVHYQPPQPQYQTQAGDTSTSTSTTRKSYKPSGAAYHGMDAPSSRTRNQLARARSTTRGRGEEGQVWGIEEYCVSSFSFIFISYPVLIYSFVASTFGGGRCQLWRWFGHRRRSRPCHFLNHNPLSRLEYHMCVYSKSCRSWF